MSPSHLVIVAVVLLLFGSKKLPEFGSALGKGMRSFKKGLEGVEEGLRTDRLTESAEADTPKKLI